MISIEEIVGGLHRSCWLLSGGVRGAVKLLLTQGGVLPDKPGNNGAAPLSGASRIGHEGVVRLLLARYHVYPDQPDSFGTTPLWRGSSGGYEWVVRLLFARASVNHDNPDNDGEALLWWASRNGHEGVVRLLLARNDVNPANRITAAGCFGDRLLVLVDDRGNTLRVSDNSTSWHGPSSEPRRFLTVSLGSCLYTALLQQLYYTYTLSGQVSPSPVTLYYHWMSPCDLQPTLPLRFFLFCFS